MINAASFIFIPFSSFVLCERPKVPHLDSSMDRRRRRRRSGQTNREKTKRERNRTNVSFLQRTGPVSSGSPLFLSLSRSVLETLSSITLWQRESEPFVKLPAATVTTHLNKEPNQLPEGQTNCRRLFSHSSLGRFSSALLVDEWATVYKKGASKQEKHALWSSSSNNYWTSFYHFGRRYKKSR